MLHKKECKKIFIFILIFVIFFSSIITALAENKVDVYTGYNIVFVVDNSGSLEETDPANLRKTGLSKILSWLPGTNSRAGLVIFSTQAESYENSLRLIRGKDDVMDFSNHLPDAPDDWTNITDGLETALSYINESKGTDSNLHNLIVLFSDGNIELQDKSNIEPSRNRMLNLAKEAKDSGIEIAAIALNNNGTANVSDMRSIASENLFIEVKNADNLEAAFATLHESKFKSETTQLKNGENHFWVKIGSSALNINFEPQSADDDFILTSPMNQKSYTKNSPEVYQVGNVYVLNIPNPTYGQWRCDITSGLGTGVAVISDNTILKLLGDVITPVPSFIVTYGLDILISHALSKGKSKWRKVGIWLTFFIISCGFNICVYYGGAILNLIFNK